MPAHRDRSRSPGRRRHRERDDEGPKLDTYAAHDARRGSGSRQHDEDDYRSSKSHRDERRRKERSEEVYDDKRRESKSRRREREESASSEDLLDLDDLGVKEITEEDYFIKSAEFKYWLKEERGRYLDELSSESAHKYFRRFVRRWNDGALREKYYRPPPSASSSSNTAYKWSFANRSGADTSTLASIRADVDKATHNRNTVASKGAGPILDVDESVGPSLPSSTSRRDLGPIGPSLPSASDRQLALEDAQAQRKAERKAAHRAAYNKADEAAPKAGGKEGKMDEKRATNAVNREMRDKEVGGLELDEGTLMGDSGSFAAAIRARDAARSRRQDKRAIDQSDRRVADDERLQERKRKESQTMDMFKALAKQRFG